METLDLNGNPVSTVGEYEYDGDGKRVKKHVPSTGEVTVFVYDAGGKLIGEYSTVAAPQSPKVSYTTADHLGSPRILTDQNGTTISRRDFMPFGEEIARSAYGSDTVRQKFTGYERDGETDLDFAQARMYAQRLGRFTAADPLYFTPQRVVDPQQLSLFAYVRNNPLRFVDPTGLDLFIRVGGDDYRVMSVDGRYTLENFDGSSEVLSQIEGLLAQTAEVAGAELRALVGTEENRSPDINIIEILFSDGEDLSGTTSSASRSTSLSRVGFSVENMMESLVAFATEVRYVADLMDARNRSNFRNTGQDVDGTIEGAQANGRTFYPHEARRYEINRQVREALNANPPAPLRFEGLTPIEEFLLREKVFGPPKPPDPNMTTPNREGGSGSGASIPSRRRNSPPPPPPPRPPGR